MNETPEMTAYLVAQEAACEPDYEIDEDDLGDCPYLARWNNEPGHDPEAICSYGCVDEPQCVTCVPLDGWPSRR